MDYKEKYNAALERAKDLMTKQNPPAFNKDLISLVFPELKESEDERIRKALKEYFINSFQNNGVAAICGVHITDILAWLEKQESVNEIVSRCRTSWYNEGKIAGMAEGLTDDEKYQQGWHDALEKQGEQKPSDKIKPKFKVGDWVVDNQGLTHQIERVVENVTTHTFGYDIVGGGYFNDDNEGIHLWTIQDANNGDVLYHKAENGIEYIVMSKGLNENNNIDSYFRYNSINGFGIDIPSVLSAKCDSITPATKEQRDLLFQKMKEAGYKWNAEKKELKKIEQKPAWSEVDEERLSDAIFFVREYQIPTRDKRLLNAAKETEDWLKSLKQRIGE